MYLITLSSASRKRDIYVLAITKTTAYLNITNITLNQSKL